VTTTRHKTIAPADALLTLWVVALTGIVLLCGAPQARAAATSQAVGAAVLLQASAISSSNVAARIGAVRAPRGTVSTDRDAILVRGLMSSPMALPPLHPRATRRYETTTVASLSEGRRPHLAVEVEHPRVHVKRREGPAMVPVARKPDEQVQGPTLRDACTAVASRRGPPPFAGRRTA
jgi:hypothetical protein